MILTGPRPGDLSGLIWCFFSLLEISSPHLNLAMVCFLLLTTKMSWSLLCTKLQIQILKEILLPSDLVMKPCARSYQRTLLPVHSLNVLRVSRGMRSLGLSIFHRNVFTLIETDDSFINLSHSEFSDDFVRACEHYFKQVGSLMAYAIGDHVLARAWPQVQRPQFHQA